MCSVNFVRCCFTWSLISVHRECLASDETLPWAAVSVWGFEDAPVSWKLNEHGWYQSGDNHYNIIVFRTGQYWILTALATHDVM